MQVKAGRVRAFSNGTEYDQWNEKNCGDCTLCYQYHNDPCGCPLYKALGEALYGDGTVSVEIATEYGWNDTLMFLPDCPKRDEAGGRPNCQWTPRAGDIMRRATSGYTAYIDHVDGTNVYIRRIDTSGVCRREIYTIDCLLRTAKLYGVRVDRMFQWHETPKREGVTR